MKYLKKFNESFLDRLESAVKGKSNKGKLIEEMLKKNNLPMTGYGYTFLYLGGSDLTDEQKSHPISYLINYEQNKGKLSIEDGKMILKDNTLNSKKVVNILPMIDKTEKEGVEEHGRIWSSAVIKFNYRFDLSKDIPTFTTSDSLIFNIENGIWEKNERIESINGTEELDGDIESAEKELVEHFMGIIWNQDLLITYQKFIEECNKRKDVIDIISKHYSMNKSNDKEKIKEGIITNFNNFI